MTRRFESEEERVKVINVQACVDWRGTEHGANRPYGIRDFFLANDVCPSCQGRGCAGCRQTGGGPTFPGAQA